MLGSQICHVCMDIDWKLNMYKEYDEKNMIFRKKASNIRINCLQELFEITFVDEFPCLLKKNQELQFQGPVLSYCPLQTKF